VLLPCDEDHAEVEGCDFRTKEYAITIVRGGRETWSARTVTGRCLSGCPLIAI
jgi:hypothetical protein